MKASLLDRLIDSSQENRNPLAEGVVSTSHLRRDLGRDLENLLNSRCFPEDVPKSFVELRKSPLFYGLTDSSVRNVSTPTGRLGMCQEIEWAIHLFEPRLQNVAVSIEDADRQERGMILRIDALLVADSCVEPIRFDTFFDVNKCQYRVAR